VLQFNCLINNIDPSGLSILGAAQGAVGRLANSLSAFAMRVSNAMVRVIKKKNWIIWDIQLKSGVPWFEHNFIWARSLKRGIGYHVWAARRDMARSRSLGIFVKGLFIIIPQRSPLSIGPIKLPVRNRKIAGALSSIQFIIWNIWAVQSLGAYFPGGIEDFTMPKAKFGIPYQIPDCNCITWTKEAARKARQLSLMPF
jgi:hypothetical protein